MYYIIFLGGDFLTFSKWFYGRMFFGFLTVFCISSAIVVYADNDISFNIGNSSNNKAMFQQTDQVNVLSDSDAVEDIVPDKKKSVLIYEPPAPKTRKVKVFKPYSYELDVNASFYYWHDDWPEGSGTGITYCGNKCVPWYTVAVDPDVIPLGSKVYINGREYLADDIGGAIKGNKLDIAVNSREEAFAYGRRWLHVKVVPPYGQGTYETFEIPAEKINDKNYLASLGSDVEILP